MKIKLNSQDLINEVADSFQLENKATREAVDGFFKAVFKHLLEGNTEEIILKPYGKFVKKVKEERIGIYLCTGEAIYSPEKTTIVFKPFPGALNSY